ncbi:hypothetical protein OEA41_005053 [Lepraria neglecta]|uniref:DUF7730 domain-containing protein n=1 Tax=Lepraria neglecta TaxID=209136 RepID=A0AAD9YZ14_9LECA|nr:hypothetical protein OEA41_005053 [Lepraria neglecta]
MAANLLLKLPAELRNQIYHLSVVHDQIITINHHQLLHHLLRRGNTASSHRSRSDEYEKTVSNLALTFTCRQIHAEVAPFYYFENVFSFNWTPALQFVVVAAAVPNAVWFFGHIWLNVRHAPMIRTLNALPNLDQPDLELPIGFLRSANLTIQFTDYVQRQEPRKKNSTQAPTRPSLLLDLPPELQIRVWRHVLVEDTPIKVVNHQRQKRAEELPPTLLQSGQRLKLADDNRCNKRRTASNLALALTCRQIHLEMTPIYYAEKTFSFYLGYRSKPDAHIPIEFAKAIGPVKASSVVSLKLDRPVHIPILEPLAAFPGQLSNVGAGGIGSGARKLSWLRSLWHFAKAGRMFLRQRAHMIMMSLRS